MKKRAQKAEHATGSVRIRSSTRRYQRFRFRGRVVGEGVGTFDGHFGLISIVCVTGRCGHCVDGDDPLRRTGMWHPRGDKTLNLRQGGAPEFHLFHRCSQLPRPGRIDRKTAQSCFAHSCFSSEALHLPRDIIRHQRYLLLSPSVFPMLPMPTH